MNELQSILVPMRIFGPLPTEPKRLPTPAELARVHRELDQLLRGVVTPRGWRGR